MLARHLRYITDAVTDNGRCIAPFNGAIDITVAGSAGPFTFAWTGPSGFTADTEDITALVDGVYDVLITDDNSGCTAVASITVNNIAPTLTLSAVAIDNSRCEAPFNGAIDLTVAGSISLLHLIGRAYARIQRKTFPIFRMVYIL